MVAAVRRPVLLLAPATEVTHGVTPGAPLVDLVPAGHRAAGVGAGKSTVAFLPMFMWGFNLGIFLYPAGPS